MVTQGAGGGELTPPRNVNILDVVRIVFNLGSFTEVANLLQEVDDATLKVKRGKLEPQYVSILKRWLLMLVNEQLSKNCLRMNEQFFRRCKSTRNIQDIGFWRLLLEDSNSLVALDNVISMSDPQKLENISLPWARNLRDLLPYFAPEQAEEKLLNTISRWIYSEDLTSSDFNYWQRKIGSTCGIRAMEEMERCGSSSPLRINFKEALEDLKTPEITATTREKINNLLKTSLKLKVEEKSAGDRRTRLVFSQKVAFLSKLSIRERVEDREKVQEVVIYAKKTLFIDCNLENSYMHGKNLAIIAGNVVVLEDVVFDVSGSSRKRKLRATPDQSSESRDGVNGTDGKAGESSGNVSIVAESFKFPERLTIRQNGGDGEGGQNGGKGGDGKKGQGVTKDELDNLCVEYSSLYIKSMSAFLTHDPGNNFVKKRSWSSNSSNQYVYNNYKNAVDERRIEYSFARYKGWIYSQYDLYFIVYGADGTTPGKGGSNGVGGEGGRSGELHTLFSTSQKQIKGIKREGDKGNDGENGTIGDEGAPGMNGNDMAVVDSSRWKKAKVYIGESGVGRITENIFAQETDDGLAKLNGYHRYERDADECFVKLKETRREQIEATETAEKRSTSDRQTQSKAVSQQAIIISDLLNEFNEIFENEEEMTIEEIAFDELNEEEEEEKDEEIQERIAIVRTQVEDMATHEVNAKMKTPKAEDVVRRIKNKTAGNLVEKIKLWEDVFSVCLDALEIDVELEQVLTEMEDQMSRENEAANGTLSNGMDRDRFDEFLEKIQVLWPQKLAMSTIEELVTPSVTPSNEIRMTQDGELFDVMKAPNQLHCDTPQFRHEAVKALSRDITKYWGSFKVLRAMNLIHKTLARHKEFEKFREGEPDWSDKDAVKRHLKKFMTQDERKRDEEEAEVGQDALRTQEEEPTATEDPFWKSKLESTMKRMNDWKTRGLKTFGADGKYAEVEELLKDDEIKRVFSEETNVLALKAIMENQQVVMERFTLEVDITGKPKPIGEDAKSLIFLRFLSEAMLAKSVKIYRYHQEYLNLSNRKDWYKGKTQKFNNYGEFINKLRDSQSQEIDKSFYDHLREFGLRSAAYRLFISDFHGINVQVFCESGFARMRLVESNNPEAKEVRRLFLSRTGEIFTIAPHNPARLRKAAIEKASESIQLPQANFHKLDSFVTPTTQGITRQWSDAVEATLGPNLLLFLHRLFDLRGYDVSLVDLQFLLNTLIDVVCNQGLNLDKLCSLLLGKHGSWNDIALPLRFTNTKKSLKELLGLLSPIKDRRVRALFGSKLGEFNSYDVNRNLSILIKMLSHAENCFMQLEEKPIKEWIEISNLQKWDSYEPLMNKYGHAGYFFVILEAAGRPEGTRLRHVVDEMMQKGCVLFEKLISRIAYLIYNREVVFDGRYQRAVKGVFQKASRFVESLYDPGRKGIRLFSDEELQEEYVKRLKEDRNWKVVFQNDERTLDELVKLTSSSHEEKEIPRIQEMIRTGRGKGNIMETLNKIDEAFYALKKKRLRDTQKLAVLSGYMHKKNTLCQVNTGEGKSLIITALAILKIRLEGGTVDVITSSSNLAKRDAAEMKEVFSLFGITVSHNCDEDNEKRRAAYQSAVVYGEISSFQRDYLLHNFYKKNILGSRQRDFVIVDEVDSMFLDSGSNMLYLSHEVKGMELLESLFVFIHKQIYTSPEDLISGDMAEKIRRAVLVDLFGIISKEDIMKLLPEGSQGKKVPVIWRKLIKCKMIDNEGRLLQMSMDQLKNCVAVLANRDTCGPPLTKKIIAMLTIVKNRKREINIPKYLRKFVHQHLNEFVESALKGIFLRHKNEYVVDIDKTGMSGDIHPVVTIIDRGTGSDLSTSQWSEGLQQFLQLKHGCRLTSLSLKAVFISNVTYLKGYKKISGFSGTLGSEAESESLKTLYDSDVIRVPTWKPKEFNENVPILARHEKEWLDGLYDQIWNQLNARRSVLLICKSIEDVEKIYDELNKLAEERRGRKVFEEAILYKRDSDTDKIKFPGGLGCNKLIISTNLAGRGTDIELDKDLEEAGGLHVIISFVPENKRIEDQAFGRAARCGKPGSGQMIALIDENAAGASNIFQLKQFRDNHEMHRLQSLKTFYDYHTSVEEECLKKFEEYCSGMLDANHGTDEEALPTWTQVIYFALLDEWATWLESQAQKIKKCEKQASEADRMEIIAAADKFLKEFPIYTDIKDLDKMKWIQQRPQPLLDLANILINEEKHDEAYKLLNKIIKEFPDFAAEANYYMGYLIQLKVREFKDFQREEDTRDDASWFGERFRRFCGNVMEDGVNVVKRTAVKLKGLDDSPESVIKINEEMEHLATTHFLRSRTHFVRRNHQKRIMGDLVRRLQQGGAEASSRGYAAQQEEMIAAWEAIVGNIDDILGHVPSNEELLVNREPKHVAVYRRRNLVQTGVLSPVVLADEIDQEVVQPVASNSCLPPNYLLTLVANLKKGRTLEYDGRKIVELALLETAVPLPSAVGFWNALREAGCIQGEKVYIAVKKNYKNHPFKRLRAVVPQLNVWDIRLTENRMEEYVYYESLDEEGNQRATEAANLQLKELEEVGIVYLEMIGHLDPTIVARRPRLKQFDFISTETLKTELGVKESEAEWILNTLVQRNILSEAQIEEKIKDENGNEICNIRNVFVMENNIDLTSFPESICESLGNVLTRHFSYSYALKAIIGSLQAVLDNENATHKILLAAAPYKDLYEDMMNGGMLMPSRVTNDMKIYEPENPILGWRHDFLPRKLYEKMEPMTPRLTINTAKLMSTHVFMKEKCVPASAQIRSALVNGMRQVAHIQEANTWRWYAGIFGTFASWVASCVMAAVGYGAAKKNIVINARVGTTLYYTTMMKENSRVLARADISPKEEFAELRKSHERNLRKRWEEEKNMEINQKLHGSITRLTEFLRINVLSHCLLSQSTIEAAEYRELIEEVVKEPPLLALLQQTVKSYLTSKTLECLQVEIDKLKRNEENSESDMELSGKLLRTIVAVAKTFVDDVNMKVRRMNKERRQQLARLKADSISTEVLEAVVMNLGVDTIEETQNMIESAINSGNTDLATVMSTTMHSILSKIFDETRDEMQNIANQMAKAWRDSLPIEEGELCLDEDTRQRMSSKYSEERLAKAQSSNFMLHDLQKIFLKICFREQKPEVLAHMIHYNYPMSPHCLRRVFESLMRILHGLEILPKLTQISLWRNNDQVYYVNGNRKEDKENDRSCHIELRLNNGCFYTLASTEEENHSLSRDEFNLFDALCMGMEEMGREFPLDSSSFQSKLEETMRSDWEIEGVWEITDLWSGNEKLLPTVPY